MRFLPRMAVAVTAAQIAEAQAQAPVSALPPPKIGFLTSDGTKTWWAAVSWAVNFDGGCFDPGGVYGSAYNFDGGTY